MHRIAVINFHPLASKLDYEILLRRLRMLNEHMIEFFSRSAFVLRRLMFPAIAIRVNPSNDVTRHCAR